MKINIKQAIEENWTKTIRAWCADLEIGKTEQQMLEQYHRAYVDINSNKRIGQRLYQGNSRSAWLLNYQEFKLLQEYRAKRATMGRPRGAKDTKKRKLRMWTKKNSENRG